MLLFLALVRSCNDFKLDVFCFRFHSVAYRSVWDSQFLYFTVSYHFFLFMLVCGCGSLVAGVGCGCGCGSDCH